LVWDLYAANFVTRKLHTRALAGRCFSSRSRLLLLLLEPLIDESGLILLDNAKRLSLLIITTHFVDSKDGVCRGGGAHHGRPFGDGKRRTSKDVEVYELSFVDFRWTELVIIREAQSVDLVKVVLRDAVPSKDCFRSVA
jgi:hypothetical protein